MSNYAKEALKLNTSALCTTCHRLDKTPNSGMLSGYTFSQQGPVINSSTMSHLKGLWAAGETMADLTVWSWWELVSSPHGLFRYNWVTHLSVHRWPVCCLSPNSIPERNHSVTDLSSLSFWSAVRLTPAFVCFRLYPCTRVWEGNKCTCFWSGTCVHSCYLSGEWKVLFHKCHLMAGW